MNKLCHMFLTIIKIYLDPLTSSQNTPFR
uniref:Uncharacterized protein n=1 Tax=Arundo donax TaxID=35708 RepID=A0A0A9GY53_ARUDO